MVVQFVQGLRQTTYKTVPCDDNPNGHEDFNECMKAHGSSTFIDMVMKSRYYYAESLTNTSDSKQIISATEARFTTRLISADLVMVDTAINDCDNERCGNAQNMTEILIHLLMQLPNFPSILYLGTSSKGPWKDRMDTPRNFRFAEVSEAQSEVARYYHLPYISVLDALGPFDTPEKVNFYLFSYQNGNRITNRWSHHPSELGHEILAALIMHFMLVRYSGNGFQFHHDGDGEENASVTRLFASQDHRIPEKLMKITQDELDTYLNGKPVTVDANNYLPSPLSSEWEYKEDVQGKPGLMSFTVGSSVSYVIPMDPTTMTKFTLHISLLKSYEHMGHVSVEVLFDDQKIADRTIDCLWQKQSSEAVIEPIDFYLRTNSLTKQLVVIFTIVKSHPPREENKIKLLGISLF